jgi:hypothetical protein
MDACFEIEETLFDYIISCLTNNEAKNIHCGNDILNSLSNDAEEDIKHRAWELIKQELNYKKVVEKVQDWLKENSCEEVNEEEEETCNCDHEQESEDED